MIVPARNRDDVDELDDDLKKDIEIRLADTVMDVVNAVLVKP
jgi:ATP-dependent Lon protease